MKCVVLSVALAAAGVVSSASPAAAFEADADNCLRRAEAYGVRTIAELEDFSYRDPWCSWDGYYAVVPLVAALTGSKVRLVPLRNGPVREIESLLWHDQSLSWRGYYERLVVAMLSYPGGRWTVQ